MNSRLIIGTRKSELALWQANWVKKGLQAAFPQTDIHIKKMITLGDKILDLPLSKIGDKGLFTKALDVALLDEEIDIAVHSLKDVPTQLPDGLTIGGITRRWDARDAFISREGPLEKLPQGATVATGSLRRKSQLLHARPDLNIVDIRGNLNTRFKKFDASDWQAMILAVAGVERLEMQSRITEKLSYEMMLPAVGQGSFALICRENDTRVLRMAKALNHQASSVAAKAERAMLRALEGGCQVPIGAYARMEENQLVLSGCIGALDGSRLIRDTVTGTTSEVEDLGRQLAKKLMSLGGAEILQSIRSAYREVAE